MLTDLLHGFHRLGLEEFLGEVLLVLKRAELFDLQGFDVYGFLIFSNTDVVIIS